MVIMLSRSARASRRKTGKRNHVSVTGACGWPGAAPPQWRGERRLRKTYLFLERFQSTLPARSRQLPRGASPGRAASPAVLRPCRGPRCCWSAYPPSRDLTESRRAVILLGHSSKQFHIRVRCEVHCQLLSTNWSTILSRSRRIN